jgi:Amino acid transporters
MKNPAREFPKAMFMLAAMVGVCAVLGSVAMGMLFTSGNLPDDLMANGAYAAFQMLGEHYGIGKSLMYVYAFTQGIGQIAALAFSIDAPLRILLADADPQFVPAWLRKTTAKGTLINGFVLTGILVSIVILMPLLGIGNMNELVKWLTNLNSVVMPMRYMWVFFAFIMLNRAIKHFTSEYKFIKQKRLAMFAGIWCFLFTLVACVLGMVPKVDFAADPSAWWFQLTSNILTPVVLILLGMLLPFIARREQKKSNDLV